MTLFAPDLYRNFFIGFIAGGVILAAGLVEGVDGFGPELVTEARASETARSAAADIVISNEFLIPEEDAGAQK